MFQTSCREALATPRSYSSDDGGQRPARALRTPPAAPESEVRVCGDRCPPAAVSPRTTRASTSRGRPCAWNARGAQRSRARASPASSRDPRQPTLRHGSGPRPARPNNRCTDSMAAKPSLSPLKPHTQRHPAIHRRSLTGRLRVRLTLCGPNRQVDEVPAARCPTLMSLLEHLRPIEAEDGSPE